MRLIHAGGFTQDDRKQWRAIIFSNLVQAFEVVIKAMEEQDTQFENPNNSVCLPLDDSLPRTSF